MNDNRKLRELRKLLYKNNNNIYFKTWDLPSSIVNSLDRVNLIIECLEMTDKNSSSKFKELSSDLNLTDEDIIRIMGYDIKDTKSYVSYYNSRNKYNNRMVSPVRRDNKSSVNRGSGAHGNYIRYPSKKRSLYTWRNFYRLFPWLAVEDEWNGRTSKRYNNGNNKNK